MTECPCKTCCRDKQCAEKCQKHKEWFAAEWKKLREIYLGVGEGNDIKSMHKS